MGKKNKSNYIEKGVSFSESMLWSLQREYFDKEGIAAWHNQVPFYITSNPHIANSYAQVFAAFMQDVCKTNNSDTFYIVELATGSGKFSFHVIKKLLEIKEILQADFKFCYVLTDFTDNNIKFWQEQSDLQHYVDQGILDFAKYDIEANTPITLLNQNITLDEKTIKQPLMVIGNYTFDTIAHDIFRVAGGQLQLATTVLKSKVEDQPKLDDIDVSFKYKTLQQPAYDNEHINQILDNYTRLFKNDTTFLLPIATLKCLDYLQKITNNRLLLLSTDKGYVYPQNIEGRTEPHVASHGSFSMMVNFHAIGEYTKALGGDVFHQSIRKSIKTSAFTFGYQFANLPQTHLALQSFVEEFGPGDFFNFHTYLKSNASQIDLSVVLSQLQLSRWDPRIFNVFIENILNNINTADKTISEAFEHNVPLMEKNLYHMPGIVDYYFDIAVYYHSVGKLEDALRCYRIIEPNRQDDYSLIYNMALCEHFMGNLEQALVLFKRSLVLRPDSPDAKNWVNTLEG